MIILNKELKGSILDIGGGGEGFIGRVYGDQVIAIDNSQEELDEAPDGFKKVFMDATDLKYENSHFDNVTFFYTLMYMTALEQVKAISEAARVLKNGGLLTIWDCDITCAYPEPLCIDLDVLINNQTYHTTYGVVKNDTQSLYSISKICSALPLISIKESKDGVGFYLSYEKGEK